MPPVASRRSCDVCRKRKTKCLAQSESAPDEAPCANCARLRLECTYNYVPKRSGRPSLSAVAANNQQSSASASTSNGDGRNPSTSSNGLRHGSGNDSSASPTDPAGGDINTGIRARHVDSILGQVVGSSSSSGMEGVAPHQQLPHHHHQASTGNMHSQAVTTGDTPSNAFSPSLWTAYSFLSPLNEAVSTAGNGLVPLPSSARSSTVNLPSEGSPGSNSALPGPGGGGGVVLSPIGNDLSHFPIQHGSGLQQPSNAMQQQHTTNTSPRDWHNATTYSPGQLGAETDRSNSRGSTSTQYHSSGLAGSSSGAAIVHQGQGHRPPSSHAQSGSFGQPLAGGNAGSSTDLGSNTASASFAVNAAGNTTQGTSASSVFGGGARHGGGGGSGRNAPSATRPTQAFYLALRPPEIQIDDVADWNTISFFTSLYLRWNHSLSPTVHIPSFTKHLAMRRDKFDRQFRAFVLGLVTYTIGQSPIGRLTELCSRQELEKLQSNCHRASMVLHDRRYEKPSLYHIGTLIYGHFFCQSNSYNNEAAALLAEACQVSHLMKLHDDSVAQSLTADFCELNLRKRVFWYLFAIDMTEASAGLPIHLHEHEGYPGFPLESHDELITPEGAFPQPIGRVSAMTGFVVCVKLFIIISGCLIRRRSWNIKKTSGHDTIIIPLDIDEALGWISNAQMQINELCAQLPPCLAFTHLAQSAFPAIPLPEDEDSPFFGMQRANLAITALSARFLLCSYKADVQPHNLAISLERDALAQEGIRTLANIPMDDLAANGESMRGKIFRILLALLDRPSSEGFWDATMQEWWNMYTNVQFVQIIVPKNQSLLPSREPSPG